MLNGSATGAAEAEVAGAGGEACLPCRRVSGTAKGEPTAALG